MESVLRPIGAEEGERGVCGVRKALWSRVAAAYLCIAAAPPMAWAAPGDLDSTFGVGGVVTTDVAGSGRVNSLAVQPDGKIVVAGGAYVGGENDVLLARYASDGSLDGTFGSGGVVRTSFAGSYGQAYSVAVQPDGKIVVLAITLNAGGMGSTDVLLVRYASDGSLDGTFGSGGIVMTDIAGGVARGNSLAVQPDGKIVVVGGAYVGGQYDVLLARYASDGSLDGTFGSGGVATTDATGSSAWGYSVAVPSDGKIVVAGYAGGQDEVFLARYASDGSLDGTFGSGGVVTTDVRGVNDGFPGPSVAVQPDGKIVVPGYAIVGGEVGVLLARYVSDGSLDGTFGSGGVVTTGVAGAYTEAFSVAVQPDGKIVVAGWASADVFLARYDPGSLCGDGVVGLGEECDDGNAADRDGCSSSCLVDVDCPVPASGCFELTKSGTPLLLIKDKSPDQKDSLKWVWNKGQCTLPEDFGDPTSSTSMELELLREGAPVFSTTIGGGGTCGPKSKDCWKAVKGGYKYVDPSATTGVKSLLLKSGAEGKSKIIVVAKGESVQPPTLPVTGPVTARLTTSTGTCFEARYADFVKNESELLKAVSE